MFAAKSGNQEMSDALIHRGAIFWQKNAVRFIALFTHPLNDA
jgi:hypothetical protein